MVRSAIIRGCGLVPPPLEAPPLFYNLWLLFHFRHSFLSKAPMPRRYVNELSHQEAIDQVFVAGDKQLRPNRNGNLYLQVDLSDRTGSIAARLWNANETLYKSFDNGDYVRVVGTAQLFQGAMQIIATKLCKVDPAEVDPADFAPSAGRGRR